MICNNCSYEIPDGAKICPNCNAETQTAKKSFWKTGKASSFNVFVITALSICLFFTSFAALSLLNLKTTISATGIANIVFDFLEDVPITKLIKSDEFKQKMTDIEDVLAKEYGATVPPKTMEKVLNSPNVKKFFANKAGVFVADCFEKDYAELAITNDHIYDLLIENQDALHKEINTTLTKEQIRHAVDKTMGNKAYIIMTSAIIKGDPTNNTPPELLSPIAVKAFNIVKICSAIYNVIIAIFISLLIIFIMLKINLPKGSTATSVSLIIVSTLYIIIGTALVPVLISALGDFENNLFVAKLVSKFFNTSTTISIILLILSIGALIFKGIRFKKKI